MPEPTLHTDKIRFGGKILYQDDKITVVPAILMAEGVQNSALKPWEEFFDPEGLEGALWFEGVPTTREHPPGHVTHLTPKIGRIRNVQFDEERHYVTAEAVLFNKHLTPDELQKVESGEELGGSIGYWCVDEPLDEPMIWQDSGEEYNVIQRGPFFGDHFALVAEPACAVCGFNKNSSHDCKCKKTLEVNDLPDESTAAAGEQPKVDDKNPPAGDPKPPEDNSKAVSETEPAEAPKNNALDMGALVIKAKTILEMADDYAKRGEALALLMEIVTEGGTSPAANNSQQPQKKGVEMDSKLKERLEALEAQTNSQAQEIAGLKEDNKALKEDKDARDAAIKADQEKRTSDGLKANFDQAYQMDWDKLWPTIQKDGINAFLANPEHAKHWDPKGDKKQIDPVGSAVGLYGDDLSGVGGAVASVESLTKRFYPGIKPEKEGK